MELLAVREGKEVWLHQMERPYTLNAPFPGRRYVAIVFCNDETVADHERQSVCGALFSSGCRYGVFAGHTCEAWESEMDFACIISAPDYQPSDEAFTMTTSHKRESIEEILFFGLVNTSFGSHDFDRFLILFVGAYADLRRDIQKAVQSVWGESCVG